MLIAERLQAVDRLVTIAASLDIDAWADRHAYSRLTSLLNPALMSRLDARISQRLLVGARDARVPPDTIDAYLARNPWAVLRVFSDFDHRCCGVEHWPGILK